MEYNVIFPRIFHNKKMFHAYALFFLQNYLKRRKKKEGWVEQTKHNSTIDPPPGPLRALAYGHL